MKPNCKRFRGLASLLSALLLFQSCVVYHKNPTTLANASGKALKTRVTSANGETANYKYISFEDSQYYGINQKSGNIVRTPLNPENISKVVIQNKSASTWITIGAIAVPVVLVIILLSQATFFTLDGDEPFIEGGNR